MDDVSAIEKPDPLQEYQTQDPKQVRQIRTVAPPGPDQQEFVPTTASTLDDLVRNAYFVAASIDAPIVEVVNPHVVNLHYPADGSLATVKVEARSGAWGGLQPKSTTPEQDADRNAHYDAQLAAATPPPPEGGVTAREEERENPVYEVQRQ